MALKDFRYFKAGNTFPRGFIFDKEMVRCKRGNLVSLILLIVLAFNSIQIFYIPSVKAYVMEEHN